VAVLVGRAKPDEKLGGRGVEFLMGYYGVLDRVPSGRDEDDGFQLWIRRHDEYDRE
jgi:predicted dithiol-disulfide oxidoreductase (DUF899 family)